MGHIRGVQDCPCSSPAMRQCTSTAADPRRAIWLSFPAVLGTVARGAGGLHASVYSGSQRQPHLPAAEPRAGARPAELRHRHRRRRVPVDRRPLRLRQKHLPQCPARPDQAGLRRYPDGRQAARRPRHRPGDGVPGVRPAALAHRAAQRRAWPRAQGHGGRGAAPGVAAADRDDRARRLRGAFPARAVRRHEAARRPRARARHRSQRAADGRAVRGARCADPRPDAGGAAPHLADRRRRPCCSSPIRSRRRSISPTASW